MPLIDIITGARPNFMKIAPIIRAINDSQSSESPLEYRLIHTGQHYDKKMSGDFFEQLGIPEPDINLGVGSGTQAEQAAAIMVRYEKALIDSRPDVCLVVGDVTSTMACAITAQKLSVQVGHVEAGIRSGDWSMPEEINRIVTDSITNWFFTTSVTANDNLKKFGVSEDQIFFVGNTMIDTLKMNLHRLRAPAFWAEECLEPGQFFILTLHRPNNVDKRDKLRAFINEINRGVRDKKVIFPVHPRTVQTLDQSDNNWRNVIFTEPMAYLEFNFLVKNAIAVITDSGGVTEESTFMGVPCLTLRDNTERPETVEIGTNELVGTNPANIIPALDKLFSGRWKEGRIPDLWDGKTGERIVKKLEELLSA
jgi:UDP-N-acetylglucosamine 2-epimerase (non-hydrolysing)